MFDYLTLVIFLNGTVNFIVFASLFMHYDNWIVSFVTRIFVQMRASDLYKDNILLSDILSYWMEQQWLTRWVACFYGQCYAVVIVTYAVEGCLALYRLQYHEQPMSLTIAVVSYSAVMIIWISWIMAG